METGHEYGSCCIFYVKIMWNWVNIHVHTCIYSFCSNAMIIMQNL